MLFERLGFKLSLTTADNPEANGKVERGHGPIVKALVRCREDFRQWCENRIKHTKSSMNCIKK